MTYDTGKDFSISSQDGDPQGMWMNPSGTKLFVLGATNDTVYEYNLSTADDVSTASYTNVSLSISGQEAYPTGLCFSPDGYNMYVVGRSSDKVHQYSLTTAYDLSTASYANKEFSVVSQEANPAEVRFNNDGTRMFVVGYSSDHVNQYDLSTAYDVSTASYNNVRFSIGSQEISPYGLHFNPQGTKMYVTGGSTDDVFEYDLTTGFDVSTASYNNVTINLPNYNPRAIFVNDDGTKFYVIANTNPIRRYTCN
jgi:DNA-binding beta-propeller fold protein YncE